MATADSTLSRIPRTKSDWRTAPQPFRPGRAHVAAVCYRLQGSEVEFLLVRTRAGRWTFPKGGVDNDPSFAAAAAREAYEEAGVKGRIEGRAFVSYLHSKCGGFRSSQPELTVAAHLCRVSHLVPPEELYRCPTWFSAEKAKRRLRESRRARYADELERVIDCALGKISARQP